MTTITGKQRKSRCTLLPRLAPLALGAMLMAAECRADLRVTPTVSLTERYTDNLLLASEGDRHSQFITELTPALSVVGSGPRFQLGGTAQWRHFDYRRDEGFNTLDHSFEYNLSGRGTLVDDMLSVEASASATPQSISPFGPQAGDAPYLSENRTKIKTWSVRPRFQQRLGRQAVLALNYTRDAVSSDRNVGFANSRGDSMVASLTSGPAYSTLSWGLSYVRQNLEDTLTGKTSSESASANLRYAVNRQFGLTARTGYDRYDYQGLGGSTAGRNWSMGFDWTPSLRTRVNASLGRHFYGRTGEFALSHRSRRTAWNISYDDGITTSRSQFLLPATFDTAALLDNLFTATIPDPTLRREAVASYMRNYGLPPSLDDSINYLSNRYLRQKSLVASAGFHTARMTGAFSMFGNERTALSDQQSDSALLGSQLINLNDRVKQYGASASTDYRLNSRTSASAGLTWTRSRSIDGDFADTRRDVRLGLTRQFGRKTRGSLELRRSTGSAGINAGQYHENTLLATLSAQL